MKLATLAVLCNQIAEGKNIIGTSQVSRTLRGEWIEQFYDQRVRREEIDGAKGFRPLATMMLYMTGFGSNRKDPQSKNNFEMELVDLETKFTNYGCYCWIDGVDAGVIGGGLTKDVSDHHCKELYRCYKCVNNDYAKNYTDVGYSVDFSMKNGVRQLDCNANSKQDAQNICECDKRFAENIAAAKASCQAGDADDAEWGAHCMDEQYRTATGGGTFDPRNQCSKKFHGHDKDSCCGIYPNRYPYDSTLNDCCRTQIRDPDTLKQIDVFSVQQAGVCSGAGGDVVRSLEGDPHTYINA